MVDWYLGTIGFTYPEWKGSFYPSGLPASQSLNYYSKIFNAVEINTTFYGPQSSQQIERWVNSTPEDFCFCLKTPRRITHELRLADHSPEEMRSFLDASLTLDDKMGPFLIQLPPSFQAEQLPQLAQFFNELFIGGAFKRLSYAIEFRHPSWYVPKTAAEVIDLLRQFGVCWVSSDYEKLPMVIHPTAGFLYLRWIAKHNVIPHPGHEVIDRTARLKEWLKLIDEVVEHAPDKITHIYGFFDNDYAGHAPDTCNKLKKIIGLPVTTSQAGEQGRLF